jgi:hypothetical protein
LSATADTRVSKYSRSVSTTTGSTELAKNPFSSAAFTNRQPEYEARDFPL